ncbi:hypothetical protein C8234_05620 [Paracidovorax avenae]|uniref:DUF6172 family protein n=1 Tax=Paracidovorax avenae TaxID=80867 RepID=UPI000D1537C6|nr:DUF6172 family protein [Paracidovorax avenae]AVS77607.1 hypothetical protein C8234_05620 [Paracidovorax avenae]AVT19930.1 hypothetical protein C7Y68_07765 [Paracidovorax avenae]
MRKTYVLHIDGKNRDRLLDAARHDIHRYLRRERRRALPEGARFWDFDCRFGRTQDDARSVQVEDITRLIDGVAQSGDAQFYVEIVARPGEGMPRKPAARPAESGGDGPHDEDGDGADGGADGGGDGGD